MPRRTLQPPCAPQMHSRLAQLAVKLITGEGRRERLLAAEGEHVRPFTALARMSRPQRQQIARELLEALQPELIEKMADGFSGSTVASG